VTVFSQPIKKLPPRFKQWLEEEVVYIITPTEKEVFLQLKTDKERELFIKAFWKQRDPTPGTPENEFKEEHYRRINYANHHFGRGVPKPGWQTDRGRIYIILGEPRDIQSYTGNSEIFNAEVWFYQGLSQYGLPPGFNLIFYQKNNVGEYVLYSPSSDGPQALLTSYFGDQADYMAAYRTLKRINPALANISLSLIPGERAQFGRPSLASDILLQNIISVPKKRLNDIYAKKFLMYKDIVEVDYSTNYIDNNHSVKIFQDPTGLFFVHYAVELNKFSVQQFEQTYSTHLKINGYVADHQDKTIYQFENSFSIKLNEEEIKKIYYLPFDLYDMFPLIPGSYQFSIIVKNEVSKEFTTFEKEITIPAETSSARLSSLILSYKLDKRPTDSKRLKPFKIGDHQLFFQPRNIFRPQDTLFVGFQILNLDPSLIQKTELKFEFLKESQPFLTEVKKVSQYPDRMNFIQEFPLEKFPPGHYQIKISLIENEKEISSQMERFEISPAAAIPRPWVYSREILPPTHPLYSFIIGRQLFNKGEMEKAEKLLAAAYNSKPDSLEYALSLAKVYFALHKYAQTKRLLLPFANSENVPYQLYLILGNSHQLLGEFQEAIGIYKQAIDQFGLTFNLLNSLGECYYRLGLKEEALASWEKSLEIKPNQPEITKKIKNLKKGLYPKLIGDDKSRNIPSASCRG